MARIRQKLAGHEAEPVRRAGNEDARHFFLSAVSTCVDTGRHAPPVMDAPSGDASPEAVRSLAEAASLSEAAKRMPAIAVPSSLFQQRAVQVHNAVEAGL